MCFSTMVLRKRHNGDNHSANVWVPGFATNCPEQRGAIGVPLFLACLRVSDSWSVGL